MKINETRTRSLLKAASFRVLEITVDALLLSFFVSVPLAVGLAVAIEGVCFGMHFLFERVWNRIDYGRGIKDEPISR